MNVDEWWAQDGLEQQLLQAVDYAGQAVYQLPDYIGHPDLEGPLHFVAVDSGGTRQFVVHVVHVVHRRVHNVVDRCGGCGGCVSAWRAGQGSIGPVPDLSLRVSVSVVDTLLKAHRQGESWRRYPRSSPEFLQKALNNEIRAGLLRRMLALTW